MLNKVIFFLVLGVASVLNASIVEYELLIEKKVIEIKGKKGESITINGSIPGPVLRFKEGDLARIKVKNQLDESTSIHWHGILVPPNMDGVPYVSFPPIPPKSEFVYEFPIRQYGTYWYHAHKKFILFPKILLSGEAEYDSHKFWEGKISINYILNKSFHFITLWHSKFGLGVGIKYKF